MTFVEWLEEDIEAVQEAATAEGLRAVLSVDQCSADPSECWVTVMANSRHACEVKTNNKGEVLRHKGVAYLRGKSMIARLWAQYQEGDHA